MTFYRSTSHNEIVIRLRVQPRAASDALGNVLAGALKIRITAPPSEGKANAHLIRFLAKTLSLKRSQIHLETGATTRVKSVRLLDLDPQEKTRLIHWCRLLSSSQNPEPGQEGH